MLMPEGAPNNDGSVPPFGPGFGLLVTGSGHPAKMIDAARTSVTHPL
jgi:hypothetical protein